jgi:hypothetical protein
MAHLAIAIRHPQIDHGFRADQRLSLPVQADVPQQPVLDPVPFAHAGQVSTHDRGVAEPARRVLQMPPPCALPEAVAAVAYRPSTGDRCFFVQNIYQYPRFATWMRLTMDVDRPPPAINENTGS